MAAPLRDRLCFLSRLPVLLRGTADQEEPCPGFVLEEISKISRESAGSSQCLLEFLLGRLRGGSCHVKLKVLKILQHTCAQGSPQFVLQLRRNAAFIREAAAFTGPPDPLHGNSLNQKVRAAAQDLASFLFSDAVPPTVATCPARPLHPAGMGSKSSPCSSMQGFGFSSERGSSASAGEALLSTIQRAAEAVANAVLPSLDGPRSHCGELHEDTYQPVTAPSPARSLASSTNPPAATTAHIARVSHQPGLAGGGWEEADSGHSSQNSSQENGDLSRTSDTYSKSGSDSHSGTSRELVSGAERVDADSLGDCLREVSLVSALTQGARVFLTREEAQHFLKECGLLNCEVVLELLSRALEDPSDNVRMRSMSAISSLMCSDLLALDQIFAGTRQQLQQLSQGSPGPVANRATKILRQFEALCGGRPSPKTSRPRSAPSALTEGSAPCTGDLLTDIPPLPAESSILQPLSAPTAPSTAAAVGTQPGLEAEPWEQPGPIAVPIPHSQEAESRLGVDVGTAAAPTRSLSLFAGMELVAAPSTALSLHPAPAEPRTLPQPRGDTVPDPKDSQPSAFSFLNA
ncbi:AP-4 complex accessory subunit tepsin [Coturnix japonica]|uniref:TEPSIN adaptor related protein complex 4 accessory protein n=1 Tax=Coturnix japonica TaxID=93934 RepID=A0A8C2UII9_COTJA|nr:AP-4 complex accessory subunit tepsin [Coturnix japonica]